MHLLPMKIPKKMDIFMHKMLLIIWMVGTSQCTRMVSLPGQW
jgi:hypothetical protein